MNPRNSNFPGAIAETVTRYIGFEVSLSDDFSDDLGLDSIDQVNLITAVEQAHGIELSDKEIASVSTLRDLLSLLKGNSGNRGAEAGIYDRTIATGGSHEST